jgi:hypothetical protein
MSDRESSRTHREFIKEIADNQQNIVWPGPPRNGRSVDKFLWRGSPNPTVVQRIGALLFGICYLISGIAFFGFARKERSWLIAAFGLGALLLGIKVCFNGLRKSRVRGRSE